MYFEEYKIWFSLVSHLNCIFLSLFVVSNI